MIDNGLVRSEEIEIPSGQDIADLLEWAENTGVTDIIVRKIDKNIKSDIAIHAGIREFPDEIIPSIT